MSHPHLILCVLKMGTSSISKNLKVYGKETDLGFYRTFSTILFFRSKFSRKSGRSSSVPVITDSWLDPEAHTLVWDRSGKEGRTWVGYSVSVLPGVVPTGPRVSFKRWEQIFRLPILYLTTTQAIPSTCNGKASLHFPTLC